MASQSAGLRALIAAIPYVGGSIEALVADPATTAVECRLKFMFAELHREMRVLDESRIRTNVLETDAWSDIVRHAVASAATTRDTRRLSAIARVLAATATGTLPLPGHVTGSIDLHRIEGDQSVLLAMLG